MTRTIKCGNSFNPYNSVKFQYYFSPYLDIRWFAKNEILSSVYVRASEPSAIAQSYYYQYTYDNNFPISAIFSIGDTKGKTVYTYQNLDTVK